jgi:hypothetical protein
LATVSPTYSGRVTAGFRFNKPSRRSSPGTLAMRESRMLFTFHCLVCRALIK